MTKIIFLFLLLFIKYHSASSALSDSYLLLYSRFNSTGVTSSNVTISRTVSDSQMELTVEVDQNTEPHFSTFVDGQNYSDMDRVNKNLTIDDSVVISFWDTIPDYARFRNNGNESYMDFFFYGCQQLIPEYGYCLFYQGDDDSFCLCYGWFTQVNCENGTMLHYGYGCDDVIPTETTTADLSTTTTVYPTLKDLSEQNVTIDNAGTILHETLFYTEDPCSLTPEDVSSVATILEKSVRVQDLPLQESQLVLWNIDNIMSVTDFVMAQSNSSDRFIDVISTLMLNMADKDLQYLQGENLGLSSSSIKCGLTSNVNGLVDLDHSFEMITDNSLQYDSRYSSIRVHVDDICVEREVTQVYFIIYRNRKLHHASIDYATYKNKIQRNQFVDLDVVIFLESGTDMKGTVHKISDISLAAPHGSFQRSVDDEDLNLNTSQYHSVCEEQLALLESSPVMAATVLSEQTEISRLNRSDLAMAYLTFNTTDGTFEAPSLTNSWLVLSGNAPMTVWLNLWHRTWLLKVLRPLHGQFIVTWWINIEHIWSTYDQCTSEYHGEFVTAKCFHLNDMTMLVNGMQNDPSVCNKALQDLSYLVNSLSVASLALLLFIKLCSFSKVLVQQRWMLWVRAGARLPSDVVHTAYIADLLLFYIIFTTFSNQKISGGACEIFGAVSYVLLMASIFLTIFLSIRTVAMFLERRLRNVASVLTRTPAALGIVFVIIPFVVSLVLFLTTSLFERNDGFCWIRPDLVIYSTVIPISVLLLNGLICTIIVCWRIFGAKRKFKRSGQFMEDNKTKRKVIAVIIMQFTLGMPWVLQYFTLFSPYIMAWDYLFTLVIGSHGTILGLLYLYKRRCVRVSQIRNKGKPPPQSVETDSTNVSDSE